MQRPLMSLTALALTFVQAAEPSFAQTRTAQVELSNNLVQESENSYAAYGCETIEPHHLKIDGLHTKYELRNLPSDVLVDATHGTFRVGNNRRRATGVAITGSKWFCWYGGNIAGNNISKSHSGHSVGIRMGRLRPNSTIFFDGTAISNFSTAISISDNILASSFNNIFVGDMVNECILFGESSLARIENSLFDGCHGSLISAIHSNRTVIELNNNVIRIAIKKEEAPLVHFSRNSNDEGMSLRMHNNIVLFEGELKDIQQYMNDIFPINDVDCSENVFIFPDMSPNEEFHIDCGRVTSDTETWLAAREAWLSLYHSRDPVIDVGSVLGGTAQASIEDLSQTVSSQPPPDMDAQEPNMRTQIAVAGVAAAVSSARRSAQRAVATAEHALASVTTFLGRWSDDTIWMDGTGWSE